MGFFVLLLIFGQVEVIRPLLRPNKFSAFLDTYDKETLPRDWSVLGFLSIYTMTSALEAIPHPKNALEAGQ